MKSASFEIVGFGGSESYAQSPKHDEHQHKQILSGSGGGLVVDTEVDQFIKENRMHQSPCGTGGHGKLTSMQVEEKQEFGITKQDGNGAENALPQKSSERAWMEGPGKTYETPFHDADRVGNALVHVDVDACNSQMGKLSIFSGEEKTREEGQVELFSTKQGMPPKAAHVAIEQNGDLSSFSSEHRQEHETTTPPRKQAGWSTLEEPEFTIEDSSWPTLAEARHAKSTRSRSSQARSLQLVSDKEVASISLPAQKLPSSQANVQERPLETLKHTNAITSTPGSKYKSPYKKGGYGKPSYLATENLPLPPMGVHVPSANMLIPDYSVKGNGLVGFNKYLPGPHQAPAHGPFYYPRAEGLAPFSHNAAVPSTYGRGHAGWQHYGRGYSDANYKHTGFIPPPYHLGPRHTRPLVTPFMNMNAAHYNYQSYRGDMPYTPGAPSPGFNYATPYFRPSGSPGVMPQAPTTVGADIPTLQEVLQKQIEYYFSTENLCHDKFLTSKMDDEGFVPLSLIANFPRVRSLTCNTMLILEALRNSTLIEVKNGKLRSHDWRRWKPNSSGTFGTQGIERSNPLGSSTQRGLENARDEETGEFEDISSLIESRMVTSSYAAPCMEMSANVGAVSVPMITSIDSR